ncbi:MAG: hypothetical protein NTX56_15265, partial [Proteobacteria bacterium]|nr:hypothetical protein [Pseudomonadota bacterium]
MSISVLLFGSSFTTGKISAGRISITVADLNCVISDCSLRNLSPNTQSQWLSVAPGIASPCNSGLLQILQRAPTLVVEKSIKRRNVLRNLNQLYDPLSYNSVQFTSAHCTD